MVRGLVGRTFVIFSLLIVMMVAFMGWRLAWGEEQTPRVIEITATDGRNQGNCVSLRNPAPQNACGRLSPGLNMGGVRIADFREPDFRHVWDGLHGDNGRTEV